MTTRSRSGNTGHSPRCCVGYVDNQVIVYKLPIFLANIGISFSRLTKISHRNGFIDRESVVAQSVALTFLTIGIATTIGSDDLLAAFAAGLSLSQIRLTLLDF